MKLDLQGALEDLAASRAGTPGGGAGGGGAGGGGGEWAWQLRMCHAALALEEPRRAARHAAAAAAAARHDGQRVWAELFTLLLADPPRRAGLRRLAERRGAAPQALLQALLGQLQGDEGEQGDSGGEAEEVADHRLAACLRQGDSELGSALLTTLALTAVARHASSSAAEAAASQASAASSQSSSAAGSSTLAVDRASAAASSKKRRRDEEVLDALNAALILSARMQDAHTQCAVLEGLVRAQATDDPPQADECAQHLRAKRQALADAVGAAKRSAAFRDLFGREE